MYNPFEGFIIFCPFSDELGPIAHTQNKMSEVYVFFVQNYFSC